MGVDLEERINLLNKRVDELEEKLKIKDEAIEVLEEACKALTKQNRKAGSKIVSMKRKFKKLRDENNPDGKESINTAYAEKRNSEGLKFLFRVMRSSRPHGFMMFSCHGEEEKLSAAISLLKHIHSVSSNTTGEPDENSKLYTDAITFCSLVPHVKESKNYIYQ